LGFIPSHLIALGCENTFPSLYHNRSILFQDLHIKQIELVTEISFKAQPNQDRGLERHNPFLLQVNLLQPTNLTGAGHGEMEAENYTAHNVASTEGSSTPVYDEINIGISTALSWFWI
jgi:hypothetical protein